MKIWILCMILLGIFSLSMLDDIEQIKSTTHVELVKEKLKGKKDVYVACIKEQCAATWTDEYGLGHLGDYRIHRGNIIAQN